MTSTDWLLVLNLMVWSALVSYWIGFTRGHVSGHEHAEEQFFGQPDGDPDDL